MASQEIDFNTPGNYTYDSDEIEVTGSNAQLRDQFLLHQTNNPTAVFAANFQTGGDAVYSAGTPTVPNNGSPTYTGGKVNLDISGSQYLHWDGDSIAASTAQTGAVRFLITPNYSGSPTGNVRYFLEFGTLNSNVNRVRFSHQLSGQINVRFYDQSAATMLTANLGVWGQTSGQEYEFELNWDFNLGATRLFIDGVQLGSTQTATGTRSTAVADIHLGEGIYGTGGNCGAKFNELLFFSTPQHTANYTPIGVTLPVTKYVTTEATIINNTSVFASEITAFAENTANRPGSDALKYIVNSGAVDLWWSGAAAVASNGTLAESNTAADLNANAAEFLSTRKHVKIKTVMQSADGSTTPSVGKITLTYDTALADPTLNNIRELSGFTYGALGAVLVGQEIKIRPYQEGQNAGDVFIVYKYQTLGITDTDGYFSGEFMVLDGSKEHEIKIGTQSYRATLPDQAVVDLNNDDIGLTLVED